MEGRGISEIMVKLFTAFITVAIVTGCFANSGTQVAERPVTVIREPIATTTPTTTTTIPEPNLTRQYFSGPDLPEWVEQRYRAVTVSEPSEIESVLCSYGWDCQQAKAIAFCESSNRVDIVSEPNSNGTRDYGLMQINSGAWGPEVFGDRWDRVLELKTNVAMAWHIYKTAGNSWQPWTCKKVLGQS